MVPGLTPPSEDAERDAGLKKLALETALLERRLSTRLESLIGRKVNVTIGRLCRAARRRRARPSTTKEHGRTAAAWSYSGEPHPLDSYWTDTSAPMLDRDYLSSNGVRSSCFDAAAEQFQRRSQMSQVSLEGEVPGSGHARALRHSIMSAAVVANSVNALLIRAVLNWTS